MRIKSVNEILFIMICLVFMSSCSGNNEAPPATSKAAPAFQADSLTIKDSDGVKKVWGQVLYVPIYSNIPCKGEKHLMDLSAFIAIHNTDLHNAIRLTKVLYFNNDGELVSNFLTKEIILRPMASTNYHIPQKDQSGTGANFLIEWRSDTLVSEPLIESVMIDCEPHSGISFLSRGKIIREIR
jgi:hypothetical protein